MAVDIGSGIAPAKDDVLLGGFISGLRSELRKKIMVAIEPEISSAIENVIASLEPAVQQHVDRLKHDWLVRFTVKIEGKRNG